MDPEVEGGGAGGVGGGVVYIQRWGGELYTYGGAVVTYRGGGNV